MRVENNRRVLCFRNAENGIQGKKSGTSKIEGRGNVEVMQETGGRIKVDGSTETVYASDGGWTVIR